MRRLADVCYGLVAALSAPIWLPRMIRTGKHRTDWAARFGRVDLRSVAGGTVGRRILIHAVSVGEVNACRLLIDALTDLGGAEANSDGERVDVVLAVTTDTGFERAKSLFGDRLPIVRYPLDLSFAVERFLNSIKPDVVVLVELEVWPNFISSCERRGIPVCVINGRLTARSHRRYRLIRPLVKRTFGRLAIVAAQSKDYAERFIDLGTPPDRVHVTGTMKWDTAVIADEVEGAEALAREIGIDGNRPLIVAGSTAPGEHALLHRAVPKDVQLMCAPRKPEWFDRAAADLPDCIRRSRQGAARAVAPSRFLLDSIGELRQAYALARVVVIGRTFVDLGGSDMMEPVALGKPTIVGPFVSNFQQEVDALREGGGLIQTTEKELSKVLEELLSDEAARKELAERGRAVVRRMQGATGRHREMILEVTQAAHEERKFAVPAGS